MAQANEAIKAYTSLLLQATIPLILGSFKSLKVSSPATPRPAPTG